MLLISSEEPLPQDWTMGRRRQGGGPQAQQAGVGPQEVDQGQYAAYTLAQAGGDGRAGHAPVETRR